MKCFFLVLLITFNISAQEKWSLDKCLDYAKENNIEIQKQKLQNKIIDAEVKGAKNNFMPDFNFNASQGFSLGNSYNVSTGVGQRESRFNSFSLSSSISIFNGFSNSYRLQHVKLEKEKGEIDIQKLKFDLEIEITKKYLQILFNKEILKISEEQIDISKRELERIKKLFISNLIPKTELLEMEATYENDFKEMKVVKNDLEKSYIELLELLDVKNITDFDILDFDTNFDVNLFQNQDYFVTYDKFHNISPHINSLIKKKEINDKNIKIINTNFYPKLDLFYSFNSSYYHIQGSKDVVYNQDINEFENNGFLIQLNNNKTHYLGFSLTIPIFNKFQVKLLNSKAKIEGDIINLELEMANMELENKIKLALNDLRTSEAVYLASASSLKFRKDSFNISQNRYNKNQISTNEFLLDKFKYIKEQAEYTKSKYDYFFRIKILEFFN